MHIELCACYGSLLSTETKNHLLFNSYLKYFLLHIIFSSCFKWDLYVNFFFQSCDARSFSKRDYKILYSKDLKKLELFDFGWKDYSKVSSEIKGCDPLSGAWYCKVMSNSIKLKVLRTSKKAFSRARWCLLAEMSPPPPDEKCGFSDTQMSCEFMPLAPSCFGKKSPKNTEKIQNIYV